MSTYEWLGILVAIVGGFWTLHHDLQQFVRREDCDRERGEHCTRIGCIETRLGKLENRVTRTETTINERLKE